MAKNTKSKEFKSDLAAARAEVERVKREADARVAEQMECREVLADQLAAARAEVERLRVAQANCPECGGADVHALFRELSTAHAERDAARAEVERVKREADARRSNCRLEQQEPTTPA